MDKTKGYQPTHVKLKCPLRWGWDCIKDECAWWQKDREHCCIRDNRIIVIPKEEETTNGSMELGPE